MAEVCCVAAVGASQLAAAGVSGAWRLGNWDLLQSYLEAVSTGVEDLSGDEMWEVQIGRLLSSLSTRSPSLATAKIFPDHLLSHPKKCYLPKDPGKARLPLRYNNIYCRCVP